jgi:zinc/manganese transport system ATP-binding protein
VAAGEVRVDGAAVRHGNPVVGYLPQRHSYDGSIHVRARDVVRLGVDGNRLGLPLPAALSRRSREAEARVDELLALVEATDYADRPIGGLSGGQQQRLLIAQSLARRPRLLLLDEPLDSLDLPSQAAVSALLARIRAEAGVTVVIVAHDVNPILPHLDRVVFFAGGRAACGHPDDVITAATLSRLYGYDIEVLHTADGRPVVVGEPDTSSFHPGLHHAHDHGVDHVHDRAHG